MSFITGGGADQLQANQQTPNFGADIMSNSLGTSAANFARNRMDSVVSSRLSPLFDTNSALKRYSAGETNFWGLLNDIDRARLRQRQLDEIDPMFRGKNYLSQF